MNPIDSELESGLTWATYRERITRNSDVFDEVYRNPTLTTEDLDVLRRLQPFFHLGPTS